METVRQHLWMAIIAKVGEEYAALSEEEKHWIAQQLRQIEQLQQQLHQLVTTAGGTEYCRLCRGECCAHGHNHLTLANLLSFLARDESPPRPDFSQTCPFLGPRGCQLTIECRPYNCVTFICDRIEDSLTPRERTHFYALDRRLRALYRAFAQRYDGATATGLLIREQRLPGGSYFALSGND